MKKQHVGIAALAMALCVSAVAAAPAATNPPLAAATNWPRDPGAEAKWNARNERLTRKDDAGLQQETQIMKLLERPEAVKELNLSDDQKNALKKAREDFTPRCAETIRKLETSLVRQVELLKQDTPDAAALDKAVEVSGRLRTDLAKLRMQHLVVVLKTINPDQRRKLNDLLRKAGDKDKKKGADNGRRERVKQMLSDRKDAAANTHDPAAKP